MAARREVTILKKRRGYWKPEGESHYTIYENGNEVGLLILKYDGFVPSPQNNPKWWYYKRIQRDSVYDEKYDIGESATVYTSNRDGMLQVCVLTVDQKLYVFGNGPVTRRDLKKVHETDFVEFRDTVKRLEDAEKRARENPEEGESKIQLRM